MDPRVFRRYEMSDEAGRLWRPGIGELVRLRTWDILARFLPAAGRIADVGGGPGTHAKYLVDLGYDVVVVDPVPGHVEAARTATGGRAECVVGDARQLQLDDASVDVVLLMGPLYHLQEPTDRIVALRDAHRVLKPGGRLLAEVISRHAWILDAMAKGIIDDPAVRAEFEVNIETGLSCDPDRLREGGFWAYFHRVEEVAPEIEAGGFCDVHLVAVEGPAWLLGNLRELTEAPQHLLQVLRTIEAEPPLLGVSAHVMAVATRA